MLYSIVIPAYNEEMNIESTLSRLVDALQGEQIPSEVLVVNDSSSDQTSTVVEQARERWPAVRLINNDGPRGFGRAIRCGLSHISGEAVAVVMADDSDDPQDVVRCYRKLEEGYDCVFGSRFLRDSRVTHYPPLKLFVNRIVNRMLQLMFATRHNDLTNAFKVYRRHVIDSITPLQAAHFNITIEMSLSALIRGYRIAQVPINWSGRTWGQSNLRLRQMGRRYLATLIKLWFERILIRDDLLAEMAANQSADYEKIVERS
jgi:dolichol-phosphate mannosyltransferase